MFTPSRLSRAQFRSNKSSEGQEHVILAAIAPLLVREWMNDYVHSVKKLKLKYWTLPCQKLFKFGAGHPVVCKTAYFIPVLIHGACGVVSVVPGKLMLLIGNDTLKVLEVIWPDESHWDFSGCWRFSGQRVARESRRTPDGSTVATVA